MANGNAFGMVKRLKMSECIPLTLTMKWVIRSQVPTEYDSILWGRFNDYRNHILNEMEGSRVGKVINLITSTETGGIYKGSFIYEDIVYPHKKL